MSVDSTSPLLGPSVASPLLCACLVGWDWLLPENLLADGPKLH